MTSQENELLCARLAPTSEKGKNEVGHFKK
jgi:hypothetical protein